MPSGDLMACAEGDRWSSCGGKRELLEWDGVRAGVCEKCGTVTDCSGEDFTEGDDVFALPSPGAIGMTVSEQMQAERFSGHRVSALDDSDIQPFTRSTRY